MKIVIQDGDQSFAHIMETVKKDPASWQHWNILYINVTREQEENNLPAHAYLVNYAGHICKHLDAVAYLVDNNQLFILCRGTEQGELRMLGTDICEVLFTQHKISASHTLYEPSHDWRTIIERCPRPSELYRFEAPRDDEKGELHQTMDIMQDILQTNLIQRRMRDSMRILLVEDDPVARRIFSRCMEEGQHLITSDNARDAVTQYALHAPNIVFLDIGLPDFSGHSVLEAITAYDPNAYVVIFSGNSFIENIACALESGAHGFIEKPFRRDRLEHYLKRYQEVRA